MSTSRTDKEKSGGKIATRICSMDIRRDLPAVLEIENESFNLPWSKKDFTRYLNAYSGNGIGMVAKHSKYILGFMIYEVWSKHIELVNLAVRPDCRRKKIGTQLIEKLKGLLKYYNLNKYNINKIVLMVHERNVLAQLFFRDRGFRWVENYRGSYEQTSGEDYYIMEYPSPPTAGFLPVNRISQLLE